MIQELVRQYADIRRQRQAMTKQIDELREQETHIVDLIISAMRAEGVKSASTESGTVSIRSEKHPNIKDWDTVLQWAIRFNHLNIFQHRVNSAACRELEFDGIPVPGLEFYEEDKLYFKAPKTI